MLQVFRDLQRGRKGARLLLWVRELGGLTAAAAREWAARLRTSPIISPPRRSNQGRQLMESVWQDIRYAVRGFLNRPLLTLVVVLTLALGIGANTAIFSLINGILLSPLPFPDPQRIVTIWEDFSAQGGPEQEFIEVPNFFIWKEENTVFETLSAFRLNLVNLTQGGEPEQLNMGVVSYDYLATFAVDPSVGRDFSPQDDQPGAARVVILSHDLWQRRFGGEPTVVGTAVQLSGNPYLVIGIAPSGFRHTQMPAIDLWTPLRFNATSASRQNFFLRGIGRLKEGVTLQRAVAEMNTFMDRIGREFPENRGTRIRLIPLHDLMVQPARAALWALMGAVALVLLIGCANIANLMLGRAALRRREIAIRAALGAGRRRLVRQMLTESVLMALAGGLLGLLAGYWGLQALVTLAPANTPRIAEVALDGQVLLFTLAASLATGLIFGIIPALQTSRRDVNRFLHDGGRQSQSLGGRSRLRGLLVVSEVALALLLLIGSGLLIRSFNRLLQTDLGFQPSNLYSSAFSLPSDRYAKPAQRVQFFQEFIQSLSSRPGIDSAAAVSVLPLGGSDSDTAFLIEGRPAPTRPQDQPIAWFRRVTPGYFETMRIPILQGREFTSQDHSQAPIAAIVSQVTAQRYWPGQEVIGQRIRLGGQRMATIVGVVPGVRHNGLERAPRPELYICYAQFSSSFMNLVLRSRNDLDSISAMLRAEVRALDAELPLSSIARMEDLLDSNLAPPRFIMALAAGFSLLALLLAVVGIYGVLSFNVSRRSAEMGVRMALGARRSDVLLLIVRQGLFWTACGLLSGLLASLGVNRLLASLLFGVSPTDGGTFLTVSLSLALVAAAACLLPALRATRIDPLTALRCE